MVTGDTRNGQAILSEVERRYDIRCVCTVTRLSHVRKGGKDTSIIQPKFHERDSLCASNARQRGPNN
jgi:hypothetical protein